MDRIVEPSGPLRGRLRAPGDKSISHRALILGAMADGESSIRSPAAGNDVRSTATCLASLGFRIDRGPDSLLITSAGWDPQGPATLDAQNSGTTMRLLMGALAGAPGEFRMIGDASLSARPMNRVAEPLRSMGARVELEEDDYPPVGIKGGALRPISFSAPVASAQVKGAVLLAAIQAEGRSRYREPYLSRDHTERMLAWLGVKVADTDGIIDIDGGSLSLSPFDTAVPGDFSSAAFLLTAAVLLDGSEVEFEAVGLNPSRTGLLDLLARMGAEIEQQVTTEDPEPCGTLAARSTDLEGVEVDEAIVPRVIDEVPLIAVAATQASGETVLKGAGELRVKESDRIAVLAAGLRELGAAVEELPDGLVIGGPTVLREGSVDPEGDHRMALAFAVAGLISTGPVRIRGWECTAISYPEFDRHLSELMA
jgi:3-phosphoshikimate 1-carboxyvinyltransferase